MNSNLPDLSGRLDRAEDETKRTSGSDVAERYAGAVITEVVSPLESLNNLVFLLGLHPDEPDKVALYANMAQAELLRLNEIAHRTLLFCRDHLPSTRS